MEYRQIIQISKNDKMPGLTVRLLLIVLILVPINSYFLLQMELVRYTFPTWIVPLSNVIFFLAVVMVVNHLIRQISPRLALRHGELLVLYVMLSITTTMSAGDLLQAVLSVLGYAFWFATPENEFQELFIRHLPRWLTVSDEQTLRAYYRGDSSLYLPHNLKVWMPVVLAWLLFFMILAFNFLCLNTILRRQWTEHERLTYPIAQLALEMTSPTSGFFGNKRMWIGFSIAASIGLINGLSVLFPQIPFVPVKRTYFTVIEGPLRFLADDDDLIRLSLYPFAIGILFLMPLDMLFSTIFFCGMKRVELMLGRIVGWDSLARFPFQGEQVLGGFLGLCVFLFWTGKEHFKGVIKSAFEGSVVTGEAKEPILYRTAVRGLLVGLISLAFLLYRAGMTFWVAATFGILFLLAPTVMTRLRAEAGVFTCFGYSPRAMLSKWIGTRRLGPQNLTSMTVCFFNSEYRPQQMPHQLEGFKISEQADLSHRRMFVALLVATGLGVLVSFWIQLHLYHKYGAASGYFGPWALGHGRRWFGWLRNWIYYPTNTDWPGVAFMGIGFSVMMVLTYLRSRVFWLPLHPLGFLIAGGGELPGDLLLPLIICAVAKWLILKHGGIRSYQRAIPFFLGLVLGDFLMGSIWSLLSILLNTATYEFYP